MVQGAEFIVNGIELKIKNTPKNKPMKVEVKSKEGELGKAQIQMYNPGKKGATLLVTKSSGEGFDVVKTIADVFIEMFLNVHLKGLIKGEEEMKQYIRSENKCKGTDSFKCDKCEKSFSTKHGLSIHLAWHTKKAPSRKQDSQNTISTNTVDTSFIEN